MQEDFHYYATYCASLIAGFSRQESLDICYSAQLADWCTRTFLSGIDAPSDAATTQLQMELMDAPTTRTGLQDITKIWASFHFLPFDLYADCKASKAYQDKFRLICGPNGALAADTVNLAAGRSLQAVGLAMHVIADTWAHRYFAGTSSLVINNTNYHFFELIPVSDLQQEDVKGGTAVRFQERHVDFRHDPTEPDDVENSRYTNTMFQYRENSVMNLGHGRAGHLPDYSFIRYKYLPAWGNYGEIIKDNPSDYLHAFAQMVHALKYLRGELPAFETEVYDWEAIAPWRDEIIAILEKRQPDACADWKALGEKLSRNIVEPFDMEKYRPEYMQAENKDETFLGKFILAALRQKSMVTTRIFESGNKLAGKPEYNKYSK